MRKTDIVITPYLNAAGGWGSMKSLARKIVHQQALGSVAALTRRNKPAGFVCTSCAWAKPAKTHLAEFCENGAKGRPEQVPAAKAVSVRIARQPR